jgi:hypothetical protein
MRNGVAKGLVLVGAVLLGITAFLHLHLGCPPLEKAIEDQFIQKAPNMSPDELLAIWAGFSVLLFAVTADLIAGVWRRGLVDAWKCVIQGAAVIGCALVMLVHTGPGHIAIPLLSLPGAMILAGGLLFRAPVTD